MAHMRGLQQLGQFKQLESKHIQISPDRGGWTPLHLAVHRGDLPMAQFHLKQGAFVVQDTSGLFPHETPFMLQSASYPDMSDIDNSTADLIEKAITIDGKQVGRGSAVSKLCWPKSFLDNSNISINMPESYGKKGTRATPLHAAVFFGDLMTVEYLLSLNQRIIRDTDGLYPHEILLSSELLSSKQLKENHMQIISLIHQAFIIQKKDKKSDSERIYKAAKNKNSVALKKLLKRVTPNIRHRNMVTPVSQLIEDGDIAAVKFLKKFSFPSMLHIAYGCGKAGKTYVELLSNIAQEDLDDLLKIMMIGCAQKDHYVEEIFESVPDEKRFALANCAIYGYALAGNVKKVFAVLQKYGNTSQERVGLLEEMACGYARGGHVGSLFHPLNKVAPAGEQKAIDRGLLRGHAQRGNETDVNNLLNNPALDLKISHGDAIFGYALTGNVLAAHRILLNSVPEIYAHLLCQMALGYMTGGFIALSDQALKRMSPPHLIILFKHMLGQCRSLNSFLTDETESFFKILIDRDDRYFEIIITALNEKLKELKALGDDVTPVQRIKKSIMTEVREWSPVSYVYQTKSLSHGIFQKPKIPQEEKEKLASLSVTETSDLQLVSCCRCS